MHPFIALFLQTYWVIAHKNINSVYWYMVVTDFLLITLYTPFHSIIPPNILGHCPQEY